jgi:hypothetical protein
VGDLTEGELAAARPSPLRGARPHSRSRSDDRHLRCIVESGLRSSSSEGADVAFARADDRAAADRQ